MGQGACTRSSISRVKPNSWASGIATAWIPWNMIESPTTPGTSTVANADSAPGMPLAAPIPCPIFGNTYRKTKHNKNGCTRVRIVNSILCFHKTTRSRWIRARRDVRLAAVAERVGFSSTWRASAPKVEAW